ncbi:hypothetical protein Tsubulata_041276 [Turnera subulata]|uniref:UBX domain-containing protein n=1 Tax=Turnera subulata TaxID=218843 RepID=A0A9Q0JP80_9ROSI|nr:hypothetical protein Tsubulata_041276 [Turnera subulata]
MDDNNTGTAQANFDLNDAASSDVKQLIDNFCDITSTTRDQATFYLESHQWNLDAAIITFFDGPQSPTASAAAAAAGGPQNFTSAKLSQSPSPGESDSPNYSPSQSPSRSRSPSPVPSRPAYQLRSREKKAPSGSRTRGNVRTFADLNRLPEGDDDDEEEPQGYYAGGEKSGMLVQDPRKKHNRDSIFDGAKNLAVERPSDLLASSSSSRSFTGTGRLLSGETLAPVPPPPPAAVNHTITLWRNGFTVDDGPLRRFDDPANFSFLESIQRSECPKELEPADPRTRPHVDLVRRDDNYSEPEKPQMPFQGAGRTLGGTTTPAASKSAVPAAALNTAPAPAPGLVVDSSSPTTSIQLRLADGTRMVSRFNLNHTIRDIRGFIEASRPGGSRNYQLQTMGFPPIQLSDPAQTIEEAGIANSVVIQKF